MRREMISRMSSNWRSGTHGIRKLFSSGGDERSLIWRHRGWCGCQFSALVIVGNPCRRIDSKSDQVFVVPGLVPVGGIAFDVLLFLECVSFLLVATT